MTYSLYEDCDDEGRRAFAEEQEHYDPRDELDPESRTQNTERARRLRELQRYWPTK